MQPCKIVHRDRDGYRGDENDDEGPSKSPLFWIKLRIKGSNRCVIVRLQADARTINHGDKRDLHNRIARAHARQAGCLCLSVVACRRTHISSASSRSSSAFLTSTAASATSTTAYMSHSKS
eukprot:COSAG02_NODE_411_length_22864_cov_6.757523_14_plen_121_part_00